MRWRFLDSGALDGGEQMALDAGLMDRAHETGEAVLRVYAWSRPTLSFGRNERARGRFSADLLDRAGVGAVRRPTGGRVLFHDREVTYSVTAPSDGAPPGTSYRRINQLLRDALARLGVSASEAPRGRVTRPGRDVVFSCFAEPSAGELVVEGRKLVGSAQLRERGALLQHGSILVGDDQPRIAELAMGPVTPPLPAATLAGALGRTPSYQEVRDALFSALRALSSDARSLDPGEAARFAAPQRARFLSAEWTWRR